MIHLLFKEVYQILVQFLEFPDVIQLETTAKIFQGVSKYIRMIPMQVWGRQNRALFFHKRQCCRLFMFRRFRDKCKFKMMINTPNTPAPAAWIMDRVALLECNASFPMLSLFFPNLHKVCINFKHFPQHFSAAFLFNLTAMLNLTKPRITYFIGKSIMYTKWACNLAVPLLVIRVHTIAGVISALNLPWRCDNLRIQLFMCAKHKVFSSTQLSKLSFNVIKIFLNDSLVSMALPRSLFMTPNKQPIHIAQGLMNVQLSFIIYVDAGFKIYLGYPPLQYATYLSSLVAQHFGFSLGKVFTVKYLTSKTIWGLGKPYKGVYFH